MFFQPMPPNQPQGNQQGLPPMPRRSDFEDDEEYEKALEKWQQQVAEYLSSLQQLTQTVITNYYTDLIAELFETYPQLKDKEMLLTQRVWTLKQQNPNLSPRALLHQAAKELLAELNLEKSKGEEVAPTATPSGGSASQPQPPEANQQPSPETASGGGTIITVQTEEELRHLLQEEDDEYVKWRNRWVHERALAPATSIPKRR